VRALLLAALMGYGTFLVWTAVAWGWRGVGIGPRLPNGSAPVRLVRMVHHEATAMGAACFVVGAAGGFALFGGVLPPAAVGIFAASFPPAAARRRAERRRAAAREAWPRMVEELRLQVGSLGRSVPQALFDTGRHAPVELQPAFAEAERHWLVTTDFGRTVALLKAELADATADAVLETLLVAHEVGGTGVDRRLAALAEDRLEDLRCRRDAEAKQAGVRFARRFVLLVPVGMALAGLSIGSGREAYGTPAGQVAVAGGIAAVGACWAWAGLLLRLPTPERVLAGDAEGRP
jgi:tight adherence protein B